MSNIKDIPLFKVYMSNQISEKLNGVLHSGFIGQGAVVNEFEDNLRSFFNIKNSTTHNLATVNSGTSGLHLALHLLKNSKVTIDEYDSYSYSKSNWPGINDGDEVLTTALTCTATNFPILANNMKIKWVDINPLTLNIDLHDLERKLSEKTRVIMIVHWGGYPNDLSKLREIQLRFRAKYGFSPAIIEDCAHSFGSKFNNKLIGTHNNISVFSFQAIKHLTSVDGGLIIFPNSDLTKRGRLMRWYGIDREDENRKDFRCENDIEEWGFKFHMNDVNATIGNENLKEINPIIERHKLNGKFYDENLNDVSGVTLLKRENNCESSFWLYSLLVERRGDFHRYMKENGVSCSQVHERNDKHTAVRDFKTNDLYNLDSTIDKITNIPVGWWVSDEDREYIVNLIKKGW